MNNVEYQFNWILGQSHPIYGEVIAMGTIDGEQIRWFSNKYKIVSMIPLDMLNYWDKQNDI